MPELANKGSNFKEGVNNDEKKYKLLLCLKCVVYELFDILLGKKLWPLLDLRAESNLRSTIII